MPQSIFDKVRAITLGNLHAFLDHIKELRSIPDFEQYVRDLTKARDDLDDLSAGDRTDAKRLGREATTARATATNLNQQIEDLLDAGNTASATSLQGKYDQAVQTATQKETEAQAVTERVGKYDQAVRDLDDRLNEARGKLETLKSQVQAAEKMGQAAKVLEGAADLGSGPNTDAISARIERNAGVAENRLERALGKVTGDSSGGPSVAQASAEAGIAARQKARQQAKAAQGDNAQ